MGGGGLLERGAYFIFSLKRGGGLLERRTYLRGGLYREIMIVLIMLDLEFLLKQDNLKKIELVTGLNKPIGGPQTKDHDS